MLNSEPLFSTRSAENSRLPRRFQFSLFWLMITVTAVAVILGLGASLGSFLSQLLYLSVCCIVPTPLVICVVFAKGNTRAFAIGALVPWGVLFPWNAERASLIVLCITLVLSAICGVIGAGTWRWIHRSEGSE